LSDTEGKSDADGLSSAGPPAPGGIGLGGGGGVVVLPWLRDGIWVGSKLGSSPSRDVGGFSTVELSVPPEPERGLFTGAEVESRFDGDGSTSAGTLLTVLGSSVVTVAPDPQFVHGRPTCAGEVYTGRYD
jgi:hypothetical protein